MQILVFIGYLGMYDSFLDDVCIPQTLVLLQDRVTFEEDFGVQGKCNSLDCFLAYIPQVRHILQVLHLKQQVVVLVVKHSVEHLPL